MKTGIVLIGLFTLAFLGTPPARSATEALEQTVEPIYRKEVVTMGHDVEIKENEIVKEMVVIGGTARIKGTVEHDLVVVMGSAVVDGKVNGDLVVIGSAQLGPKADVRGDAVVIGGALETDPGAILGGERVAIGLGPFALMFGWLTDWIQKALFWARPFPHQVLWAWVAAGLCTLLYLAIAVVFRRPVTCCSAVLESRPLVSFLLGLLVFVISGPVLLLLIVSVVGIVVIPFLLCGLVALLLLGKTVVFHGAGRRLGSCLTRSSFEKPGWALLLGAGVFLVLYMIPVLGLVAWGLSVPLGIGAVMLAAIGRMRGCAARPAAAGSGGTGAMPDVSSSAA